MTPRTVTLGIYESPESPSPRMTVTVQEPAAPSNGLLVVVSHGRNGASEAPHVQKIVEPYLLRGYTAVVPDLCNSDHNASAGSGADFTIGGHVRDTLRAVHWALDHAGEFGCRTDQIALAGHSMGGYAVSYLAATELRPIARHVLAVAPFTSGRRQFEARAKYHPQGVDSLRTELPRALVDWPRHDIFEVAERLTMPVSTVVGVLDTVTPDENVLEFNLILPRAIDHIVLDGAHHCLEGGPHTDILLGVIDRLDAAVPAVVSG